MFKKIFLFICGLSILTQGNIAYASDNNPFPDVDIFHHNYKAISYLKSQGVINGFSDGTFGPELEISRCEFLKIVIEAENIIVDTTQEKAFPDLDSSFWCNRYAYKAKHMGVVQGDEKGSFNPQKTISRIESLKLLFLLKNETVPNIDESYYLDVPKETWFAPYVKKATSANIIAGKEPQIFGINEKVSRAQMAEMIYRLLVMKANNTNVFVNSLQIPQNYNPNNEITIPTSYTITEAPLITSSNNTRAINGTIDRRFFDDITLDEDMPKTFVLNEVYTISGKTNSSSNKDVTIFLIEDDTDDQITFTTKTDNNQHFEIPVDFKFAGKFDIGIIKGLSGESNISSIAVVNERENTGNITLKASELDITVNNDGNTIFSWNNKNTNLSKLVIKQNDNIEVVKILSGGVNSWQIDSTQFKYFEEKAQTYWTVFLANSSKYNSAYNRDTAWGDVTDTKNFKAVKHHYVEYKKDEINFEQEINLIQNIGSTLNIKATSQKDMRPEIAVILDTGMVEEHEIITNKIAQEDTGLNIDIYKAPVSFENNITFRKEAVYFIEINSSNGLAMYNSPIYVGNIIPIIPDFRDLEDEAINTTANEVNNAKNRLRTELLNLINKDRINHKLSPVLLDNDLNSLAQEHVEDMATNDYFSHVNLNNEGPSQRKLDFNIFTPVGENLAKAGNLSAVQGGLMRSAIHRANILRSDWGRVGLGLAMDKDNNLIVVQEFSKFPLNEADLINIKFNLQAYLNDKRNELTLNNLQTNSFIETVANDWSHTMLDNDFFDFTNPSTNSSLHTNVQEAGFQKSFSTLILSGGNQESLIENLENSSNVYEQDRWNQLAIGLAVAENGIEINATIVFLE